MTTAPPRPTAADVEAALALLAEAENAFARHWDSCRRQERMTCQACFELDGECWSAQRLYHETRREAGLL